jgi:phosphate transport system substrate-binding protein
MQRLRARLAVTLFALAVMIPAAASAEDVRYSGSSTIGQSILEAAGAKKAFEAKSGVRFGSYEVPGTGKGIEALLAGTVNVAGASRELKKEEEAKGIVGTVIGFDAVAVFVNVENPVNNLSKAQLKDIFTGKVTNWKEVGGNDAPIHVNTEILGEKRATMEVFNEKIMGKDPYGKGFKEIDLPRDQIIEVSRDPLGIGTPSLGLLAAVSADVRAKVKALAVDGIKATERNVQTFKYPLSRPLILATMGDPKGAAKTFIDYMLSPPGQTAVEKSFIAANRVQQ